MIAVATENDFHFTTGNPMFDTILEGISEDNVQFNKIANDVINADLSIADACREFMTYGVYVYENRAQNNQFVRIVLGLSGEFAMRLFGIISDDIKLIAEHALEINSNIGMPKNEFQTRVAFSLGCINALTHWYESYRGSEEEKQDMVAARRFVQNTSIDEFKTTYISMFKNMNDAIEENVQMDKETIDCYYNNLIAASAVVSYAFAKPEIFEFAMQYIKEVRYVTEEQKALLLNNTESNNDHEERLS